jgi:cell division septation protein DedD
MPKIEVKYALAREITFEKGNMLNRKTVLTCALLLGLCGCSREQSDWQRARETNTPEAYEQFSRNYPTGEFSAQARARARELYETRDWQKARDADTVEAYEAFLKQHPDGKDSEEARVRVENFTLAQISPGPGPAAAGTHPSAAAAVPPAAAAVPPAAAAPLAAAPLAAAAPHAAAAPPPKPHTPSAPRAGSKSGAYAVQLGAFKSGTEAADKRWARLQRQYPKLFAGLSPKVVPKKLESGTLYRLRAVGVSEHHARDICKSLKANSQPCMVIPPAHA